MKRLIFIVAITELCLFITTRIILYYLPAWETELLRTLFRGVATLVYWYYFREMIFGATPSLRAAKHPLFISSITLLLAVPLLVGDLSFMGTWAKSHLHSQASWLDFTRSFCFAVSSKIASQNESGYSIAYSSQVV